MHPCLLFLEQNSTGTLHSQLTYCDWHDKRSPFLRWRLDHTCSSHSHGLETSDQCKEEVGFDCNVLTWRIRVFD
jgi:hypothetical protein